MFCLELFELLFTQSTGDQMQFKVRSSTSKACMQVFVIMLCLGLFVTAALLIQGSREDLPYVISGGAENGVYFSVANAVADMGTGSQPALNIRAITSSGSVENVERLAKNEAHFALLQNDTVGNSATRGVSRLYEETLHLIAREDAAINCVGDLKGKRVGIGSLGSGTNRLVTSLLDFALGEQSCKRFEWSSGETIQNLHSGEIDAAFFIAGLRGDLLLEAMQDSQFRLVPITITTESNQGSLELSRDFVNGFRTVYPYVSSATIPMLTYGDQPSRALPTLSVSAILACRVDVADSAVRALTAALYENKASLAFNIPLLENVDEDYGSRGMRFPLHSGASSYYLRREPGFLSEHAESLGLFLTLGVMAWSAVRTLGIFKRRSHKEHIDSFYSRVLVLSLRINDCKTDRQWRELQGEVNQVEREAFEELIEERLKPDDAYIILQQMISTCGERIASALKSSVG